MKSEAKNVVAASTPDKENFAIQLTDSTRNHVEWLAVVRYGLKTLLDDQALLAEILVREADREARRWKTDHPQEAADHIGTILRELELKIVIV